MSRRLIVSATLCYLLVSLAAGCGEDGTAPGAGEPVRHRDGGYPEALAGFLHPPAGDSIWTWTSAHSGSGQAVLTVRGRDWRWTLSDIGPAAANDTLHLEPAAPEIWHGMNAAIDDSCVGGWTPLPREPVISAYYADLLDLLRRLTRERFDSIVSHWPENTVPVAADSAVSGAVDLRACLYEAVELWNSGETLPFFRWEPHAAWGVKLSHRAGRNLQPPLGVRMLRLIDGDPLVMMLLAGDNYSDPWDRPYALRGMIHELAHTLCLWGHSEDRNHILWRCGPIVDRPSADERRAAGLWRVLPDGFDLKRYTRSVELDP